MRAWSWTAMTILILLPLAQAQPGSLYMTDASIQVPGFDGARELAEGAPTGDGASLLGHPVAGDETYHWAYGPLPNDLIITGPISVVVHFDAGIDATSETTLTLHVATPSGSTEVATDSAAGTAEALPHQETFDLDATDAVVPEGGFLVLSITISGEAVVTQLAYGGSDAASGISDMPWQILDSDGDGVGDSQERRDGTDPFDATDARGSSPPAASGNETDDSKGPLGGPEPPASNSQGSDSPSDKSVEAVLASFFFLVCLALAGMAMIWRKP